MLLFPTFYEGEGFAGTVIDALAAGVPVLASDWRYNSEIVTDKIGFTYKTRDVNMLADKLFEISQNIEKVNSKKEECIKEAQKYLPENAMKIILENLE